MTEEIDKDAAQLAKAIQRIVRREVASLIAGGAPTLESLRALLRSVSDQPRVIAPRYRYRITAAAPKGHLPPASQAIINVLREDPDQTVPELVKTTKLAKKTVENNLTMLRTAGILRTVDA